MHPLVNIAVAAARSAGNFIMRNLDRVDQLTVESKGRNDFVTQIDRSAEGEIVKIIRKAYPQHAILGEEGGASGNNEVVWIVDPLDGTTNFLHGLPHFAVSIGIQVRGKLEHGVIYAPCTQDLYIATKGSGATLNNRKIRGSTAKELDSALIGTGVPIRADLLDAYLPMLKTIAGNSAGIRRAGSAALDLAYVAAGRLDGYFELGLKPWDMAAGIVLVQEAGGTVTELYDSRGDVMSTGHILAAPHKLHAQLAEALRGVARPIVTEE
ncbi:inositol monophosphatase family protein [Nevskia sp.]|uniref:inositol monophosphatase family protein n=1 Tax=Nevskia sp. TaxID=1929292 RepID=UPI0025F408D8|nr:inositol monophosphatase family protein [Nevskia sp.]